MNKELKLLLIENYIDHFTSDDAERERMKANAYEYVKEDHVNETQDSYSFFLFSKLFDVFIGVDYEYDTLFGDLQGLYEHYYFSDYNNPDKGEYETMVDFFNANRRQIFSDFMQNKSKLWE